jgi:hypothetical protein
MPYNTLIHTDTRFYFSSLSTLLIIMATYRAKCWLGSSSGYQDLEVKANTITGAKEQFERIYGAEQVINISEVRGGSGGSSFSGSGEGLFGLAIIVGAIWALMAFLPWILMGIGGSFGAWAGNKTGKVSLAIILSLLAGGFGYYQGDKWQQEINSDTTVEQIKK